MFHTTSTVVARPASAGPRRFGRFAFWLLIAMIAGTTAFRASAAPEQTRALWVTRATLGSTEGIQQMVSAAKAGGFNTVMVQVRGRGDAYYGGTLEPRASELASKPGFDPLATVLEQAHAAGLKVHAWVGVNLVSSSVTLPASREHIVYRQPDWLMVPLELAAEMKKVDVRSPAYIGRLARWTRAHASEVEGLYTSPVHPGVQAHVAAVIGEMVANYAVDGVHLDYVRFPSDRFDYSPAAIDLFKSMILPDLTDQERREAAARELIDPAAYPNLFADRWNQFRRNGLTDLVVKVRAAVKAARPAAVLSAAVVPDAAQATDGRLQDWRGWLDQSLLDVLCPMAYTTDAEVFQQQVAAARAYAGDVPVWAGIGAYRLTSQQTLQHIAAAGKLGTAGIILFSYDALIAPPNSAGTLSELGRAAFGAGSH